MVSATVIEGWYDVERNNFDKRPVDGKDLKLPASTETSYGTMKTPTEGQQSANAADAQQAVCRKQAWAYFNTGIWSTAWVLANVLLTMYNKWGFQQNFRVPVIVTACHCFMSFLVAALRSQLYPRPTVQFQEVWRHCVLYAGFNAVFLSCNNWAIMILHPATVEVLKTVQPTIQVIVAFGIEGVQIDARRMGALGLLIVFSVATSWNPTHFDSVGFSLVFVALVCMALRQSFTGLIFKSGITAWDTILYTQGLSALFLVLPGLALEYKQMDEIRSSGRTQECLLWVVSSSVMAIFYLFTSFGLQRVTDSIYMTIAGKIKNVVLIIVSTVFVSISFRWYQVVGMVGTLAAAAMYTFLSIDTKPKRGIKTSEYVKVTEDRGNDRSQVRRL
jgi:hypothetical protein